MNDRIGLALCWVLLTGCMPVNSYQTSQTYFTVTFDGRGATTDAVPTKVSVISGDVVPFPTAPTKTGSYFVGWYSQPNGAGTALTTGTRVGRDTTFYAYWLPSGSIWTGTTLPSSQAWASITFGNGRFVAVANSNSASAASSDGINWSSGTLPSNSGNAWGSVAFGNGTFVAVLSNDSINANAAATSTDGINWTQRTLPSIGRWWRVAFGAGKFVTFAFDTGAVAFSSDGISWTAASTILPSLNPGGGFLWNTITFGGGAFVIVAQNGQATATSGDAQTWTVLNPNNSITTHGWQSVAYGNGVFAVAGYNGGLATSPDGTTWIARTNPSGSPNWSSVVFGNGLFVALDGFTGTTLGATSPDGVTWTSKTLPSSSTWVSVAYGNNIFVGISNGSASAAVSH